MSNGQVAVHRTLWIMLVAFAAMAVGNASAQSSVDQLGRSSDGAQRVFDQRIARPAALDTTVHGMNEVDSVPEFPGGMEAFFARFGKAEGCPAVGLAECGSTKVIMTFVVERDGRVSDVQAERPHCEAMRTHVRCVLGTLPPWTPAQKVGRPVRCRMRMPMNICLR
jgi:hypothetical protein